MAGGPSAGAGDERHRVECRLSRRHGDGPATSSRLVEEGGLDDAEIKELNELIAKHRKGGEP